MPLFSGAQRAVVARDRGRRLSEPGNTCGLSIVLDILRLILILQICFFSGRRARVLRAVVLWPPQRRGGLDTIGQAVEDLRGGTQLFSGCRMKRQYEICPGSILVAPISRSL